MPMSAHTAIQVFIRNLPGEYLCRVDNDWDFIDTLGMVQIVDQLKRLSAYGTVLD